MQKRHIACMYKIAYKPSERTVENITINHHIIYICMNIVKLILYEMLFEF